MPWWIVFAARAVSNRQWEGLVIAAPGGTAEAETRNRLPLLPLCLWPCIIFLLISGTSASTVALSGMKVCIGAAAVNQCYCLRETVGVDKGVHIYNAEYEYLDVSFSFPASLHFYLCDSFLFLSDSVEILKWKN